MVPLSRLFLVFCIFCVFLVLFDISGNSIVPLNAIIQLWCVEKEIKKANSTEIRIQADWLKSTKH